MRFFQMSLFSMLLPSKGQILSVILLYIERHVPYFVVNVTFILIDFDSPKIHQILNVFVIYKWPQYVHLVLLYRVFGLWEDRLYSHINFFFFYVIVNNVSELLNNTFIWIFIKFWKWIGFKIRRKYIEYICGK